MGGPSPTAEARDFLAGVAPGTFFLAGVTGLPLADQLDIEGAGSPGSVEWGAKSELIKSFRLICIQAVSTIWDFNY